MRDAINASRTPLPSAGAADCAFDFSPEECRDHDAQWQAFLAEMRPRRELPLCRQFADASVLLEGRAIFDMYLS
jgi:hypothetical protein